jgi:hypothetical protein
VSSSVDHRQRSWSIIDLCPPPGKAVSGSSNARPEGVAASAASGENLVFSQIAFLISRLVRSNWGETGRVSRWPDRATKTNSTGW